MGLTGTFSIYSSCSLGKVSVISRTGFLCYMTVLAKILIPYLKICEPKLLDGEQIVIT